MRRIILLGTVVTVAIAGACNSKPEPPKPPRTPEEQRKIDSTVGASSLPGAPGVRNALKAQDSAKARQARVDSMMKAEEVPPGVR